MIAVIDILRPTLGHEITINEIIETENDVSVIINHYNPSVGWQSICKPHHIVKIPVMTTMKPIHFVDE